MKSKNKADSQCHPQKYIIFHWNLYLSLNTIPDKNQTKTFSFQSVSEIWTRVTCSCQGEADIPAFLSVVLTTFITILYFVFFVNRFFIYFFLRYPCSKVPQQVSPQSQASSPRISIFPAQQQWSSLYLQLSASQTTSSLDSGVLKRFLKTPPVFSEKLAQQVSSAQRAWAPSTVIELLQQHPSA